MRALEVLIYLFVGLGGILPIALQLWFDHASNRRQRRVRGFPVIPFAKADEKLK
jgi:hypothetical protein